MKKKTKENSKLLKGFGIFSAIAIGLVSILVITMTTSQVILDSNSLAEIPTPEFSEGMRGELGIDKNVNESTIDNYLNRQDSVYRDMRMLVDPADYEKIGGDKYLSGFIDGFEVVPLPYIITPEGLPEAVGASYQGKTLFSRNENGKLVANYAESEQILADLFPKNKNIFLMCGGGGYAGMTKKLLVELGWDENKIWNVGGYWYYEGNHKISTKLENGNFAFWRVKYHDIDFNSLTEKK